MSVGKTWEAKTVELREKFEAGLQHKLDMLKPRLHVQFFTRNGIAISANYCIAVADQKFGVKRVGSAGNAITSANCRKLKTEYSSNFSNGKFC